MTLDPLRRLSRRALPVLRFEDQKIPLVVTTTDLQAGVPAYWHSTGDLLDPVIASMSLPGVFPPVVIGGRQHVDGGVSNNVPFAPALERGAQKMLLILCTCCPAPRNALRSPLAVLLRSFQISLETKYSCDLHQQRRQGVAMLKVEPQLDRDVGPLDFRHADALIRATYEQTVAALARPDVVARAAA
ncbi:MAG: patatin-like phospholipase family protein [Rubrivivax sp.]